MSPQSYRHRMRGSRGDMTRLSAQKMRDERGRGKKKDREAKRTYTRGIMSPRLA